MAYPYLSPNVAFTDKNGITPLVGGKVYFYAAGSQTFRPTYSDPSLLIPNANPVTLDARGRAKIYLQSGTYRVEVRNALGVVVETADNVSAIEGGGGSSGAYTLAGASDVAFTSLQNGQVPVYNSTTQKFENKTVASGGGGDGDGVSSIYELMEFSFAAEDRKGFSTGINTFTIPGATFRTEDVQAINPYRNTYTSNRTASYSNTPGDAEGWVNSNYRFNTTVAASCGSHEWGVCSVLNSSGTGENVAGYFQSNKTASTTVPLWGGVFEINQGAVGYTGPLIGRELDVWASGDNPTKDRIGEDAVIGFANMRDPTGATQCEVYAMYRVGAFNANPAQGKAVHGFLVGDPATNNKNFYSAFGFRAACNGQAGFSDEGSKVVGFQALGEYSGPAFRMNQGSRIAFDVNGTATAYSDGSRIVISQGLTLTNSSGRIIQSSGFQVDQNGQMYFPNLPSVGSIPSSLTASKAMPISYQGQTYRIKLFNLNNTNN